MTPELPPLPSLPIYGRDDQEDLCALVGAVEARERILTARIAELDADAARYRWLRENWFTMTSTIKYGKITLAINQPRWLDCTESDVDAAIDAAMAKGDKP